MEQVDLGAIIQDVISRFGKHRTGAKPHIFVTFSPALTNIPWQNRTLEEFTRHFLYEALLTVAASDAVEISLRRRSLLKDLNAFIGLQPSYWIQVRLSGRSLRVGENLIEDLFSEIGFRSEEWVGVNGSETRLGIFGTIDAPDLKMVFCLDSQRHRVKCDLLLPVVDRREAPVRKVSPQSTVASRT
jgi:hypothetical protein